MEFKTVFKASISGSVEPKDPKDPEAYKVTVVYSDGSKNDLQKTYEQFIELQGKVYNLLKLKGGYSRKTSRTLISSLPDTNSPLSRILFKDDDVKKMAKTQEFIKELFTLPKVVTESVEVVEFFSSSVEKQAPNDRLEEEEKLKKINKVAEILSGRDPLRKIPEKGRAYNSSSWRPEDLHRLSEEARDNLYQNLNRLRSRRPSKEIPLTPNKIRPASTDDEVEERKKPVQKPGLRRRPFSVAVGVADLLKENGELDARNATDGVLQITSKAGSGRASTASLPVDANTEEHNIRKISAQFGKRVGHGELSPTKTKYVAISTLAAEGRGEVSLEVGEEVDVLQKESSGWWYVKTDRSEGWAPASFLEPAAPSRSNSPVAPRELSEHREESMCETEDKLDVCLDKPVELIKNGKDYEKNNSKESRENHKTLDRLADSGNESKTSEISRRVKFLAVEGIQKRKNPDKNYVYILKVVWSDGTINIIYRQCSDFFFLQENLRRQFPNAIGKEIPVLKGRKFTENCHFCFKDGTCKRRQFMNRFCHELINAPDSISLGDAVMTFCRPRSSDVLPHHGHSDKNESKKKETGGDDENVQISGPVVFEQYVVIADYSKKNKNDISLNAGDTVDVIERNDYGWWLVDNDGELGWAPASYLEPTDDGSEITTKKSFAPGKEEVYMSVKSYDAKAGDELSFDAGVMLDVIEKTLDGWWYARNQREEGWVPAMFLRKVESADALSSSPVSGKMDELDILSFNGENGDKDGISRTPPTRRSMVKRTIRKKPKRNSSSDGQRGTENVSNDGKDSARSSESSRSISIQEMAQDTRSVSPRSRGMSSPRRSPRPRSKDITQEDIDYMLKMRQMSTASSGYDSSPHGSLSSLTSDVFAEETQSHNDGLKKSATLPRFDHIQEQVKHSGSSPVIPRSHSVTSMAHYMHELEMSGSTSQSDDKKPFRSLQENGKSSSVSSLPGKISPIPAPRKISRNIPPGTSPKTSPRQRKAVSKDLDRFTSETENLDDQSSSDSPTDYESTESGVELNKRSSSPRERKATNPSKRRSKEVDESEDLLDQFENSRLYRAVYSYVSSEDGEVSFDAGDEVEVIQRSDNGWWLVRTVNELGWGPSNFLTAY